MIYSFPGYFIRYLTFVNTELLLVNNPQAHREVLQIKCYEFEKLEFFGRVVGELVGVGFLPRGRSTKCSGSSLVVSYTLTSVRTPSPQGYDLTICELTGPFSFANLQKLLVVFNTKAKELSSTIAKQALSNPDEPIGGQTPASYSIPPVPATSLTSIYHLHLHQSYPRHHRSRHPGCGSGLSRLLVILR